MSDKQKIDALVTFVKNQTEERKRKADLEIWSAADSLGPDADQIAKDAKKLDFEKIKKIASNLKP